MAQGKVMSHVKGWLEEPVTEGLQPDCFHATAGRQSLFEHRPAGSAKPVRADQRAERSGTAESEQEAAETTASCVVVHS